jgi:ribosomal protein S18 acetylase RimI-like enzyme
MHANLHGLIGAPRRRNRYFLHNWPKLCWLAFDGSHCFGVVVCKADDHNGSLRGYIAMLVVRDAYRGLGVGALVFLWPCMHSQTSAVPSGPAC